MRKPHRKQLLVWLLTAALLLSNLPVSVLSEEINMRYDDFTPEKADFETADDFARFMDFVKSANLHENDMTVTGGDHLLTLITCDRTYGGADGRFVVMAVREN